MRAVVYARMSTDKQSETSPEDQVARCRDYAEARGWIIDPDLVQEAGISGASRHNRPGLLELMARIPEWDVLLAFDFSRLSRNEEDLGWIRNRLEAARKTAYEVSSGLEIHNVGARVMGVLNAEYLAKLRADTHRGLEGRARRKLSAGGRSFGYRSVAQKFGGSRFVVRRSEAAVVRRIFELYAAGEGIKAIAHSLNAEGIPGPRGKGWAPSALREMLRNPLYRGEYIWNRSQWIKDHTTGKRQRIEGPESEWVRQRDESWRIVPEHLWARVRERIALR